MLVLVRITCNVKRTLTFIMTTIANCPNVNEAMRLQMLLQSAGIPSFIPDENMAAVAPFHFFTSSGVRVQVDDEHAVEAQKIIKEEKQSS